MLPWALTEVQVISRSHTRSYMSTAFERECAQPRLRPQGCAQPRLVATCALSLPNLQLMFYTVEASTTIIIGLTELLPSLALRLLPAPQLDVMLASGSSIC